MSTWILRTNSLKSAELEADIVECQKKAIVMMSLRKLGLYWMIAIVCVFIPVMHFILVPLFLLIGLIAFFSQYKNTHFLQHGFYLCPVCANRIEVSKVYLYEGMKWNCDVCMEQMKVIHH